ncbi:uncharacterized protein HKW66_Vig0258360 [Vigna angularis]|uniref:Dehydrin n=1 Tax=Phaseolus angularis TaxID=3914 RepID=A0A8T0LFK2_PHAAN|nr:uncharacterized protein HKW66_Vig0258360 [Vigna angularis]
MNMEQYQNQYGAAPTSKDSVQREMETTGDTTGVGFGGGGGGGSTQVIAEDYVTSNSNSSGEKQQKGIIEKIKEKLPGTGSHQRK